MRIGVIALAFMALLMSGLASAEERYLLGVDGLACPFCAYGVEKQLSRIEGVKAVETDLEAGQVVVRMQQGESLAEARAREAVEAAGFTLRSFGKAAAEH